MKRQLIIFIICCLAITACTSQADKSPSQLAPTTVATFLPIPPTIPVNSNEDISVAAERAMNIQSIVLVYNERNQELKTINLSNTVLVKKNLADYVLESYSKANQIYVAVSIPVSFQISKYDITQVLETAPAYSAEDLASPAAVFRDLPTELSPFGEPETEGEPCDQSISGQLTITNKQPLQGNFQFMCQFQDGHSASIAGTFSQ